MRNAILVSIMTAALALGAISAFAGPPLAGTYKSTNGDFHEGREGSSWSVGGGFLTAGGTLHGESWDGSTLGGDWKILCPTVTKVSLVLDLVSGGNGQRIYEFDYTGGIVELSGSGPWGNGDPSYTGIITNYTEFRTVQYSGGVMVGSVSNHSVTANLQGYSQTCMTWGIGNGVWLGESPDPLPANYPDWRNSSCTSGPTTGHWGDLRDLTISINACTVSTEQSTWGAVKSMYRN